MKKKETFKPGEETPKSGEYKAPAEEPKTCIKGKRLPPTKKSGRRYTRLKKKK